MPPSALRPATFHLPARPAHPLDEGPCPDSDEDVGVGIEEAHALSHVVLHPMLIPSFPWLAGIHRLTFVAANSLPAGRRSGAPERKFPTAKNSPDFWIPDNQGNDEKS